MEINPLPLLKSGIDEIIDGFFIKCPIHCKTKMSSRCKDYYQKILDDEYKINEVLTCPFGFNSYAIKVLDRKEIFTGLKVLNEFKEKSNNKIESKERIVVITKDQLIDYTSHYKVIATTDYKYNILYDMVDNYIHDVKEYTSNIDERINQIYKKVQSKRRKSGFDELIEKSGNVRALNNLVQTKQECLKIACKGENYTKTKVDLNLHELFYSIKMTFNNEVVHIAINSKNQINDVKGTYEVKFIPFLIIENCIKYFPVGYKKTNNINVLIDDNMNEQVITVSSLGPFLEEEEYERIFVKGVRGKNCISSTIRGSGIGLYHLKQICDVNNFKVNVQSSDKIEVANNIPHSIFTIKIAINKN